MKNEALNDLFWMRLLKESCRASYQLSNHIKNTKFHWVMKALDPFYCTAVLLGRMSLFLVFVLCWLNKWHDTCNIYLFSLTSSCFNVVSSYHWLSMDFLIQIIATKSFANCNQVLVSCFLHLSPLVLFSFLPLWFLVVSWIK